MARTLFCLSQETYNDLCLLRRRAAEAAENNMRVDLRAAGLLSKGVSGLRALYPALQRKEDGSDP